VRSGNPTVNVRSSSRMTQAQCTSRWRWVFRPLVSSVQRTGPAGHHRGHMSVSARLLIACPAVTMFVPSHRIAVCGGSLLIVCTLTYGGFSLRGPSGDNSAGRQTGRLQMGKHYGVRGNDGIMGAAIFTIKCSRASPSNADPNRCLRIAVRRERCFA
jgi:hypothetical protein